MTPPLPRQHRRCTVYPWCTGHTGPGEREHHGEPHVVPALGGRQLSVALFAVGDESPRVVVDARFGEGKPALEVVELDPAEVLHLAATLRQLALESQQRISDSS